MHVTLSKGRVHIHDNLAELEKAITQDYQPFGTHAFQILSCGSHSLFLVYNTHALTNMHTSLPVCAHLALF